MFFRKEKKNKEKEKQSNTQDLPTREQIINDPNTSKEIREILLNQDKLNKKQNEQYSALQKAQQLGDEGNIDEAIKIAEKVMYEEEFIVRGAKWPFILSDLYLKNNLNDKCWKYFNFLLSKYPEMHKMQDKIDEIRVKILKQEGKHLDAMATKMSAILFKHSKVEFTPTEEKIEKELAPFIKRADLDDKKAELLLLVNKYLRVEKYNFNAFRKDLKEVIKGG